MGFLWHFARSYALYLAGEKRREEDAAEAPESWHMDTHGVFGTCSEVVAPLEAKLLRTLFERLSCFKKTSGASQPVYKLA